MNALLRTLVPAILASVALSAQSSEFGPLMSVAGRSWPEKTRIGVVCDYRYSSEMVADLAQAASPGTVITVADAHSAAAAGAAQRILRNAKVDFTVLMPRDPVFFEGGFPATGLVSGLAHAGIPSVGTRPVGIKQGALFCVGAETGGELLVTNRLVGTVSVILPNRSARLEPFLAGGTEGGVTVNVIHQAE